MKKGFKFLISGAILLGFGISISVIFTVLLSNAWMSPDSPYSIYQGESPPGKEFAEQILNYYGSYVYAIMGGIVISVSGIVVMIIGVVATIHDRKKNSGTENHV